MDLTASILVLYLATIMAIGYLGSRHVEDLDDFYVSRRNLNLALMTGTLCATVMGASSTIGMAGLGYRVGLPGAWWLLSGTLGLVLLSRIAPALRESGCYTLPELLGTFYDGRVRTGASVIIVVSWMGVIAAQIIASGKVLGALFGGHETLFMAASTAVFVLYTAMGGQRSVVRTDLIQFSVIAVGILVLLWRAAPGLDIGAQSFPTSPGMGGSEVVSMILVVGSTYLVGPDLYSRIFSARDGHTARRSALLSALFLVPMAFAIVALGVCARSLIPGIEPEQAIPALMTELLSPAATGIVAAALLAAFMSSADTTLLTATSILTLDLYGSARPKAGVRRLMSVSRISVLAAGSLAFALAASSPNIIKTLLLAYTVFTGGLLVPILAGLYRERLGLTPAGALAALAGGGGTALVLGQVYPLLGMAVSAVLLVTVSRMGRLRGDG